MSTGSKIDLEHKSVDAESVMKPQSAENVEGMTTTCNEKIATLCCNLKALEETVSVNKDNISGMRADIIKYEETLDTYFFETCNSKDPKLGDIAALAECFLSMYYVRLPSDTTDHEHLYIARFFVMQSVILLKDKELDEKTILTAISIYNSVSTIYLKIKNADLSLQYLNKALDLYMTYTKGQDDFPAPVYILDLLGLKAPENTAYLLKKMHMGTLKLFIKLKYSNKQVSVDMEKITTYMHKLLKKQLENIPETVDGLSWSMEAIRLAEYFSSCGRFVECKNHLVLASVVVTKFYNSCKVDAGISAEKKKCYYHQYSSIIGLIDACWVRYGLALLFLSRKRWLNRQERDNISEPGTCKSKSATQSVELLFPCTEKGYEDFIHITEQDYIMDLKEAKNIFVNILQVLNKIRTDSWTPEDPDVRVEIAQYVSRAYKYFAFYVHDKVSHLKLQKRRIDILEECLKTLDITRDDIVSSFIWFELALINSSILNLKFENLNEDEPSAKELEEIKQLVEKSRSYLQLYSGNSQGVVEYALQNGMADESYQVVSVLNIKYPFRE